MYERGDGHMRIGKESLDVRLNMCKCGSPHITQNTCKYKNKPKS